MKLSFPLLPVLLMVLLTACNSSPEKGKETPPGREAGSSLLPDPDQVQTATDTAVNGTQTETFKQRAARIEAAIFADEYKSISPDEMEGTPQFKDAREKIFHKYIRKTPIKNEYAGKIIPRIVFKSYQFKTYPSLQKNMEDWLNDTEHSGDKIVLGTEVNAVKMPPIVCAILEEEVYMMQTSCIYQGEELEALVARFMTETKNAGAKYRFRIGCNAGKLTYLKD